VGTSLKPVLWTKYKELAIWPTVSSVILTDHRFENKLLSTRSQLFEPKAEKKAFAMLISSKSIFLHPTNKT
jgi:hypothetical protein